MVDRGTGTLSLFFKGTKSLPHCLRLANRTHWTKHYAFAAFQALDLVYLRQAVSVLFYGACRAYSYRGARMILRASFFIYCNVHCCQLPLSNLGYSYYIPHGGMLQLKNFSVNRANYSRVRAIKPAGLFIPAYCLYYNVILEYYDM